ncbi:MAG: hypothetical protein JWR55_767 [Aeromicrobium sp.]|nr:hypothetical protein [Aeromicrobium sp.]
MQVGVSVAAKMGTVGAYIVGQLVTVGTTIYKVTTAYTSTGDSIDLTKFVSVGGGRWFPDDQCL